MKYDWDIIADIFRIKIENNGLISNHFDIQDYLGQISILATAGVLKIDLQKFSRVKSYDDLSVFLTEYCFLKEKACVLHELTKCDLFHDVIASIERHNVKPTIDLIIEYTQEALKRSVMKDLGL